MAVIFTMKDTLREALSRTGRAEMRIDKRAGLMAAGTIEAAAGDRFVFFTFTPPLPTDDFLHGKMISLDVGGIGTARFPLQGFAQAYLDVKNTCKQHQLVQEPLSADMPLSTAELTCRMLGVYVQQYATQRDQGVPITDALMQLRAWIAQVGHPSAIQAVHEQLLLSAYHDTWLPPVQARQQFESKCVLQMHQENMQPQRPGGLR